MQLRVKLRMKNGEYAWISFYFLPPWHATVAEKGREAKLVPEGKGKGEPVCDKWVQLDHGMDLGKPGL